MAGALNEFQGGRRSDVFSSDGPEAGENHIGLTQCYLVLAGGFRRQ